VRGIALVDPSPVHRYRPMLNYAAAGQARMARYERPMATVVPDGVELIPHAATRVDPVARTVTLESGASVSYSDLVLCPGLTPHWEETPGLQAAYVDGWAASAHVPEYAGRACAALVREREGTVVFSVPPEPASCGGTVLKAMFLACDRWRRAAVLDRIDVHLVTPFGGVLGLERIDSRLQPFIEEYGVTVHANSRVTAVDHRARTVTFDGPAPATLEAVNLAYVTPDSRAPRFVADSGLATDDAAMLVEVDPRTLRHARHETVWGLGDAATVNTRPSGGALRDQVAVVADNLRAARDGGPLKEYDGYTVIPVAVSRGRLVLDEHDRDGRPAPSVPGIDLSAPRRMTYAFDRFVQPVVYFRRLLRGRV
jgi:sulfide:quinone oxidoreductase